MDNRCERDFYYGKEITAAYTVYVYYAITKTKDGIDAERRKGSRADFARDRRLAKLFPDHFSVRKVRHYLKTETVPACVTCGAREAGWGFDGYGFFYRVSECDRCLWS